MKIFLATWSTHLILIASQRSHPKTLSIYWLWGFWKEYACMYEHIHTYSYIHTYIYICICTCVYMGFWKEVSLNLPQGRAADKSRRNQEKFGMWKVQSQLSWVLLSHSISQLLPFSRPDPMQFWPLGKSLGMHEQTLSFQPTKKLRMSSDSICRLHLTQLMFLSMHLKRFKKVSWFVALFSYFITLLQCWKMEFEVI